MSRDKQNEEMAQCLCGWNRGTLCILDDKDCNLQCTYGKLANELTAKGYRKASDLAEEIFAEIEDYMLGTQVNGFPALVINPDKFAELKKKYTEDKGRDKLAEFSKYSPLSWRNTEEE